MVRNASAPLLLAAALVACETFSTPEAAPGPTAASGGSGEPSDAMSSEPAPTAGSSPAPGQPTAQTPAPAASDPAPTPAPAAEENCNTKLFAVCDGFESVAPGQPPDPNRWTLDVPPPTDDPVSPSAHPKDNFIRVSTKFAHRGKASLQIHGGQGSEHIVMQDVAGVGVPSTFLPAPKNTFFVRFWFYFDGFTQPPSGGHMYIVNASGPLDKRRQYQKFGGNEGGGMMNYSWIYFGNDAGIFARRSWPAKAWTCYEVQFKGDTSELHVWIDEAEVPELTSPAGNWAAPAFDRVTLGWEIDHPPADWPGVDIYIDDVAYSYQRIGCKD